MAVGCYCSGCGVDDICFWTSYFYFTKIIFQFVHDDCENIYCELVLLCKNARMFSEQLK